MMEGYEGRYQAKAAPSACDASAGTLAGSFCCCGRVLQALPDTRKTVPTVKERVPPHWGAVVVGALSAGGRSVRVPSLAWRREEPGVSPGRSRHCDRGATPIKPRP